MTGSKYSLRIVGNGKKWTERVSVCASVDLGAGVVGRRAWYTASEVKGVKEDYQSAHVHYALDLDHLLTVHAYIGRKRTMVRHKVINVSYSVFKAARVSSGPLPPLRRIRFKRMYQLVKSAMRSSN